MGFSEHNKENMSDNIFSLNEKFRHLPCHPSGQPYGTENQDALSRIIGQSPEIAKIKQSIGKVAAAFCHVLITGQSGTGKELVARAIHEGSARNRGPFITLNSSTIPENLFESELLGAESGAYTGAVVSRKGKFESAHGGTVFLDEIGELSLANQAKLLRILEEKRLCRLGSNRIIALDVRVICATNQDLELLVGKGLFREDLFYRINVVRIKLPPLKCRKKDIPDLLQCFIKQFNQQYGKQVQYFSPEAKGALATYDWPGNVREMRNLLEATFVYLEDGVTLTYHDFPEDFQRRCPISPSSLVLEGERILSTLQATHWNVTQAAKALRWSRMTLYRKMARYHINHRQLAKKPSFEPNPSIEEE